MKHIYYKSRYLMNKIQRVSSYFVVFFNLLLIGVPVVILIQWIAIDNVAIEKTTELSFFSSFEVTHKTPTGHVNLNSVNWTGSTKFLYLCSTILAYIPFVLILFALKSIFKNYQKSEVFSVTNAINYRRLGWLFLLKAIIIEPISDTITTVAIALNNPPGQRYISLSFDNTNLDDLFFGALVIVISWVMLEASKLQEEQELTI